MQTLLFMAKAKKQYLKINLSEKTRHQIENLGDHLDIPTECIKKMQSFIREAVYDDFYSSTKAQARGLKWRSQKSKSFCRLPPDEDALNHHIERFQDSRLLKS